MPFSKPAGQKSTFSIPTDVGEHLQDLTVGPLRVYLALCQAAGNRHADLLQEDLAILTGMTTRAVSESIAILEQRNLIHCERPRGATSNRYRIIGLNPSLPDAKARLEPKRKAAGRKKPAPISKTDPEPTAIQTPIPEPSPKSVPPSISTQISTLVSKIILDKPDDQLLAELIKAARGNQQHLLAALQDMHEREDKFDAQERLSRGMFLYVVSDRISKA